MRLPVFYAVHCPDVVPAVAPSKPYHHHVRYTECAKCPTARGMDDGFQGCDVGSGKIEWTLIFRAVECPDRAGAIIELDRCDYCAHSRDGDNDTQDCGFVPEPEPDMEGRR